MAEAELEKLKAENASLKEQMVQLQEVDDQEIAKLWDQIDTLQKQLTLERTAAVQSQQALQQELSQVSAQLHASSQTESKLAEAMQQLAEARRQAADAQQQMLEAQHQKAQNKAQIADLQSQVEEVQRTQRAAQREVERLEKDKSRKEADIQSAHKELASYKADVIKLEAKLERAAQWEQQALTNSNELHAAQQELKQLQQELRATKEHSVALGQARAELVALQQQSAQYRQQAAQEVEQVKVLNTELRRQLDSKEREVNSLANMRNHLLKELDKTQGELKSLQEEYERSKAKFTSQASDAEMQANRVAKYKKALQQEQDKHQADLRVVKDERDKLRDDVHAWEVSYRKLRRQYESQQSEISQLRQRQLRNDASKRRVRSRSRSRSMSPDAWQRSSSPFKLHDERDASVPEGSAAGNSNTNRDTGAAGDATRTSCAGEQPGAKTVSVPQTSPNAKPVIPSWSDLERKMADTRKVPKSAALHTLDAAGQAGPESNAAVVAVASELLGSLPPGYGPAWLTEGAQLSVAAATDGLHAEPPLPGETLSAITQTPAVDYGNAIANIAAANPYPDASYAAVAAYYPPASHPGYYAAGHQLYAQPLSGMAGEWQQGTGAVQDAAAVRNAEEASEPSIPGVDENMATQDGPDNVQPSSLDNLPHDASASLQAIGALTFAQPAASAAVEETAAMPMELDTESLLGTPVDPVKSTTTPAAAMDGVVVADAHVTINTTNKSGHNPSQWATGPFVQGRNAAKPATVGSANVSVMGESAMLHTLNVDTAAEAPTGTIRASNTADSALAMMQQQGPHAPPPENEGWISLLLQVVENVDGTVGADGGPLQSVRLLLTVPSSSTPSVAVSGTDSVLCKQAAPEPSSLRAASSSAAAEAPSMQGAPAAARTSELPSIAPGNAATSDKPSSSGGPVKDSRARSPTPRTEHSNHDEELAHPNHTPRSAGAGRNAAAPAMRPARREDRASPPRRTVRSRSRGQSMERNQRRDRSPRRGRSRSPVRACSRDHSYSYRDRSAARTRDSERGRRSSPSPRRRHADATAGGINRRDQIRDRSRSHGRRVTTDGTRRQSSRSRERRDRYLENAGTPTHWPDTGAKWSSREPASCTSTHATRRAGAPSPSSNRHLAAAKPPSPLRDASGLPAAYVLGPTQPGLTPSSKLQPLYDGGMPEAVSAQAGSRVGAPASTRSELSGRGIQSHGVASMPGSAAPGSSKSITIDPRGLAPMDTIGGHSHPYSAATSEHNALPTVGSASLAGSLPTAGSQDNAFQALAIHVFEGSDVPTVILRTAVQLIAGRPEGPLGPYTITFSDMLAGLKMSMPGLQSGDLKEAYTRAMQSGVLQLLKSGEDMKQRFWKLDVGKLTGMAAEVATRIESGKPAADSKDTATVSAAGAIATAQETSNRISMAAGQKRPREPSPPAPARKQPSKLRVTEVAEQLFHSGSALDVVRVGIVRELCHFSTHGPYGPWQHDVPYLEGMLDSSQQVSLNYLRTLYHSPTLAAVAGIPCFSVRLVERYHVICLAIPILRSMLESMWAPPAPPAPDVKPGDKARMPAQPGSGSAGPSDTNMFPVQPIPVLEDNRVANPHTNVAPRRDMRAPPAGPAGVTGVVGAPGVIAPVATPADIATSNEIKKLADLAFSDSTLQDRIMRLTIHHLADNVVPCEELAVPTFSNTTSKMGNTLFAADKQGLEAIGRVRGLINRLVDANVVYEEVRQHDQVIKVNLEGLKRRAANASRR